MKNEGFRTDLSILLYKMALNFDPRKCLIPTAWCGKGPLPPPAKRRDYKQNVKYVREGTKDECLQKGVGAGVHIERKKSLAANSLQNIKYIGDVFEKRFQDEGIRTTTDLVARVNRLTKVQVKSLVEKVTTKKNGRIDHRAYNHVLLWLYYEGKISQEKLPLCHKLVAEE